MSTWPIFNSNTAKAKSKVKLPAPPPWRQAGPARDRVIAQNFRPSTQLVEAVNAALFLRRPLLVTGLPGSGKSSLVLAVAEKLALGPVLTWPIHSRSTLKDGLYQYDALARLQHIQNANARSSPQTGGHRREARGLDEAGEFARFLRFGPLGAALASKSAPRALLIDEIDKSDIDLPSDLLNVLESGNFEIPELQRVKGEHPVIAIKTPEDETINVIGGSVSFVEFPFVVMTSNGERDFPAPFLRRCVQCVIGEPTPTELREIIKAHFGVVSARADKLVSKFTERRDGNILATDQLMNAVHLLTDKKLEFDDAEEQRLLDILFKSLG